MKQTALNRLSHVFWPIFFIVIVVVLQLNNKHIDLRHLDTAVYEVANTVIINDLPLIVIVSFSLLCILYYLVSGLRQKTRTNMGLSGLLTCSLVFVICQLRSISIAFENPTFLKLAMVYSISLIPFLIAKTIEQKFYIVNRLYTPVLKLSLVTPIFITFSLITGTSLDALILWSPWFVIFSIALTYVVLFFEVVWGRDHEFDPSSITAFVLLLSAICLDMVRSLGYFSTNILFIPIGLLMYLLPIFLVQEKSPPLQNMESLLDELQSKNRELEELAKMKDEFLANTSHELRTPLNGIIGLSDSLLQTVESEQTRKNLLLIKSSGHRLKNLVNDILDFSKIKKQDIYLVRQIVEISGIIDIVIQVLTPLAREKSIQILNKNDKQFFVYGDEERIQQIIYNLFGNAIKYTIQGSITFNVEEIDSMIKISVTDTGIGIPEEKLDSIFNSFEQVDSSDSRKYGGTGLGLSITKYIVELHGGDIRVESKLGIGSTFSFTVPKAKELQGAPILLPQSNVGKREIAVSPEVVVAAAEESIVHPESPTILVVDDDLTNLQVIHDILAGNEWNILIAHNGNQALEYVENGSIDLVLLDVMMPLISGFEVCRIIRKTYTQEELPIIFVTAKDSELDFAEGKSSGGNDYLTKPVSRHELEARVRGYLAYRQKCLDEKRNLLTKTEMEVLHLAYLYPRRELLEKINLNRENKIVEKTLEQHIGKVLKKLDYKDVKTIEAAAKLAKKKKVI